MIYPFEFKEMLLTDSALDMLGFSEYWAGSADFGERSFGVEGVDFYKIVQTDEIEDSSYGYSEKEYSPSIYHTAFKSGNLKPIYFLHELYESISRVTPNLIDIFIEKIKEKNMYPYIKSWLEYKEKNLSNATY